MTSVSIKNKEEIRAMREGGKILSDIMKKIGDEVRPGISTSDLDKLAEKLVFRSDSKPAFKGYGGETGNPFPATLCTSVNEEVVHGIPKDTVILSEGDLLKVDIGIGHKGMFVDMARTFGVGDMTDQAKKLLETTKESLDAGMRKIVKGKKMSEYSKTVQEYVENNGFSVIRSLVGHGVGNEIHEEPQIPNYFNKNYRDIFFKPGMTLALEPMVNEGDSEIVLGGDGWTYKTADGKLSAHFEDTVLVTDNDAEILTRA